MKHLFAILTFLCAVASASAQSHIHYYRISSISPVVISNATILNPHFFYYDPLYTNQYGTHWQEIDSPETPSATIKMYYFDGIMDGTFDDEDMLMTVDFGSNGRRFTNIFSGAYKVQHPFMRQTNEVGGPFGTFYLYRLNP